MVPCFFTFLTSGTLPNQLAGVAAIAGSTEKAIWARSKTLLGSLTGVERARVSELNNPEPERPIAPHHRAPCPSFVCLQGKL